MDSDILRRAKLRAIHLLEYRDRTEKDMRRKLQQGDYPPEVIDKTIEYLKSYGYIDDKRRGPVACAGSLDGDLSGGGHKRASRHS